MKNNISMKPTGKVYLTFKSRNYKIYKAIAEYIDNSTQSYFDNEKKLKDNLEIQINYGPKKIEIIDNAFGMNLIDLNNALKLGGEPKRNSGRNQFGMGLKVASIWFTDNWRITTKKYGERTAYQVDIRMDDLINDIDPTPVEFTEDKKSHYTKVELLGLDNRRITGKAAKKLKEVLGTVYKRDIQSGKVNILINKEPVTVTNFDFYDHDIHGNLKKDVDFKFKFEKKEYRVKGFIGVRTKGSTSATSGGFALYDNDRVIIPNWRDSEIFKQTNSYTYQRLVGELDLIGFDVTSDKEEFDWHNGLKEEFIKNLELYTNQYSKYAEKIRTRLEPDSEKEKKTITAIGKKIAKPKVIKLDKDEMEIDKTVHDASIQKQYEFKPKSVTINDREYKVEIKLVKGGNNFIKIEKSAKSKNKILLEINRDHKFLAPKLSNPEELENYINAFMYQAVAMFYTQSMYPVEFEGKTYLKSDTFWRIFNRLLENAGENNE